MQKQKKLSYIPKRYHKYKKLWNKQFGKKLAKHALWDYKIKLKPGTNPKFFPTYKFTKIKK